MAAWVAAGAVLEQFGGDIMDELQDRMADYRQRAERFLPYDGD
jgi:hypothetical protein